MQQQPRGVRVNPSMIPQEPNTIKQRNHIVFESEKHIYKNLKTKEVYTSGTGFVGKFHEKFEPVKIATNLIMFNPKYVKRFEDTDLATAVRILTNEWKDSATKGTFVHGLLERYSLGLPILDETKTDAYNRRVQQLSNAWDSIALFDKHIGYEFLPEMLLYNDEYKIAGQSDLVFMNHEKKTFVIKDYKTNKKIDRTAYKKKRMYHPIAHIEDCNYYHYALQLSLYAYMLEQEFGYKCEGLELIWVNITNPHEVNIEEIQVPYLEKEILIMLQHLVGETTKGLV